MIKHTELLRYLLFICRPTRTLASHMKGTTQRDSALEEEVEEDVWTQGMWQEAKEDSVMWSTRTLRDDDNRMFKMDRTCGKHETVTKGRKFCQQPEMKKLFWRRWPMWKDYTAVSRQTGKYGGKSGPDHWGEIPWYW
jgi:hypothetical protein